MAALPLAAQHVLPLVGTVPEIDLIHGEQKGGHDVVALRVKAVRDSDILDAVLREELLGVVADLPHIAPSRDKSFVNGPDGWNILGKPLHPGIQGYYSMAEGRKIGGGVPP